ncbi:MAG TPA: hypothetical protein PKL15_19860, partial [Saprospiraceae bacterium]|nr:hypothetical protein [Saprospiraceae bacterium]
MTDSALFEALAALTAWELQNLRKRLQSPAFNQREEPLLLFDYCLACLRNGTAPSQEAAMAAIWGKKGALEKLRHEMSALLDLVRELLIEQEFAADAGQRELYWLRAARKRGLEKNLQRAFRDAGKALDRIGQADLRRYF